MWASFGSRCCGACTPFTRPILSRTCPFTSSALCISSRLAATAASASNSTDSAKGASNGDNSASAKHGRAQPSAHSIKSAKSRKSANVDNTEKKDVKVQATSSTTSNNKDTSLPKKAAARRRRRTIRRVSARGRSSSTRAKRLASPSPREGAAKKDSTVEPKAAASVNASIKRRRAASAAAGNKIRVCVLNSSYEGTDSPTASMDSFWCTPQHYVKKNKRRYSFADVSIKKASSYRTVRELVTSGKYDVFFNLCDGGRDEQRAGADVVSSLEEMNAAFTGTDSHSFEPSKIDMKLLVGSCGVKVPNFVLLKNDGNLAKKCRHLQFPVIVKHLSGYASVGITKDSRCNNLDELKTRVTRFLAEFNHALVEEFIRGREGTVLTCADAQSPHGVRVFRPLMFKFLSNPDDFAYFDKKWGMTCDSSAYDFLPSTDPAYAAIVQMARNSFQHIMNGVGYGRVDFRIDDRTGEPNFLEINPNCGMWYSPKDGGDFADVMVSGDSTWDHERFLANAVSRALREQAARRPWYFISHDRQGQFSTRASRTVPAGRNLFGDSVHPVPVVAKSLYKIGADEPSVGCVIRRGDGLQQAVAIRHSCEPNMHFVHGRTLLFAAKRQINSGEELTVDYATLRDESMPHFACSCGTKNCRSVIFAMPATPRTVEVKAMKKLLREKQRVWLKEKASVEAEKLIRKRAAHGNATSLGNAGSQEHSTSTNGTPK